MLPVCSDAEPYRGWRWPLVAVDEFLGRLAWSIQNRETVREHGRMWREAVLAEGTIEGKISAWRNAITD